MTRRGHNYFGVDTRMFNLFDLLDWLEDVLDDRKTYVGEYYMLFATEERYVELNISDHEIWAGAVTNYNLSNSEAMSELDEIKMGVLGWTLEEIGSPEPKWVRRWDMSAPTSAISSQLLRVFTLIYLGADTEMVEVVRGTFANGNVGWDNAI
jgi:hypothetical protein